MSNEQPEKNESSQGPASPAATGKTLSPATFHRFQLHLFLSGALLVGVGWAAMGLDFTLGVLLGFFVVLVNVFWTKNLVKTTILAGKPRGLFTVFYFLKFGLTAGVLVVAITRFEMDPFGVLAGLSALMLAIVFLAIDWTWFQG